MSLATQYLVCQCKRGTWTSALRRGGKGEERGGEGEGGGERREAQLEVVTTGGILSLIRSTKVLAKEEGILEVKAEIKALKKETKASKDPKVAKLVRKRGWYK